MFTKLHDLKRVQAAPGSEVNGSKPRIAYLDHQKTSRFSVVVSREYRLLYSKYTVLHLHQTTESSR